MLLLSILLNNKVSALVKWLEYPREPGFNTRKSQTILDGCHDYSTHDISDLKETEKI